LTDSNDEDLQFAASEGDLARVKLLIQKGCDPNAIDEDLSFTALHSAADAGHIDVVKFLLAVGADVNAHCEEKIGETPLGQVSSNCTFEMAQALITAGANPTIPGWMQLTALHRAEKRKKPEGRRVYQLLLETAKRKFGYHGD
jgi:ankyrin repeat protein